jgi:hypothetical protein
LKRLTLAKALRTQRKEDRGEKMKGEKQRKVCKRQEARSEKIYHVNPVNPV